MKKNRFFVGAMAACFCVGAFPWSVAHAAFYIDPTSTPQAAVVPQAQPAATTTASVAPQPGTAGQAGIIMHQGVEPALIPPAVGMGRNIPLMIALQQIVPAGWYVLPEHGDIPVSWKGSSSWVGTLSEMLHPINAHAVIDWEKQTVRVYTSPAAEAATSAETPAATTETIIPKEESWAIRVEDNLLSATLQRWAEEAQEHGDFWRVSWESPMDFPVMFNAKFTGSFESAVTQLVKSLASTEAPVQAIIYENHVVRIVPIGTKIK